MNQRRVQSVLPLDTTYDSAMHCGTTVAERDSNPHLSYRQTL